MRSWRSPATPPRILLTTPPPRAKEGLPDEHHRLDHPAGPAVRWLQPHRPADRAVADAAQPAHDHLHVRLPRGAVPRDRLQQRLAGARRPRQRRRLHHGVHGAVRRGPHRGCRRGDGGHRAGPGVVPPAAAHPAAPGSVRRDEGAHRARPRRRRDLGGQRGRARAGPRLDADGRVGRVCGPHVAVHDGLRRPRRLRRLPGAGGEREAGARAGPGAAVLPGQRLHPDRPGQRPVGHRRLDAHVRRRGGQPGSADRRPALVRRREHGRVAGPLRGRRCVADEQGHRPGVSRGGTTVTSMAPSGWTRRDGRPGRLGVVFAAVWLVFLATPLQEAWSRRGSVLGWVGILAIVGFAATYVLSFAVTRRRRLQGTLNRTPSQAGLLLAVLAGLGLLACLAVGQAGMATAVYVAVTAVMWLPGRLALAVVTVIAVLTTVTGLTVPGWEPDASLTFAVCAAAFAMWGVSQLMLRNMDLVRARDETARLAVAEERNRFARDLHDILGHSLTVITVKAELANRLLDVDPARARAELGDLERLSRDALADVRRTVEGYRDLTLPGELARAREALRAADIDANLPNSTDEVPSELRELFAWTVREGVTNVIRHSGATTCTVRLAATRVEVTDDGVGPGGRRDGTARPGHGLEGLRERAAAAGAALATRARQPSGFELSVTAE